MAGRYYTPETYEARKSIGYLIRRGRNLLTQQVEAMFKEKCAQQGITFQHWVILMCLRDNLASTPTEISQYICYDSGAMTRVIDQMQKRGLISRRRSNADRRVVALKLTAEGRKMVEATIPIVADLYNQLLADFSRSEADTLVSLLTRFVDKLDNARDGA
jgi:DNA-binding MarR family transcriptional regulator